MSESFDGVAGDVLAHSEDAGEWEEERVEIQARPSGTQVISTRLPSHLAERLLAEAARRGVKPSELVRVALERVLNQEHVVPVITANGGTTGGPPLRILSPISHYTMENSNLVVEESAVVALGFNI